MDIHSNGVGAEALTSTSTTSALAFEAMGNAKNKAIADRICDIVIGAAKHGRADMSLREIAQSYTRIFSVAIETATISGKVTALVAAKRLQRSTPPRLCSISGCLVRPVSAVAKQVSVF